MKLNHQIIIPFFIVYSLQLTLSRESQNCERTCNSASLKDLPSPFGFSQGCQIRLNCTAAGAMIGDEFPAQSISNETMLISIPSQCDRPIEALRYLFTENYAPTVQNGILLRNCSTRMGECFIPYVNLQTHLQPQDCGLGNETVNCYREANNQTRFIDYSNLLRTGCTSFFSSIATEAVNNNSSVSLEFQVVRLEWWLQGNCSECSDNARCIPVESQYRYRCDCSEGFVGDGYRTGFGCRKESSSCNPTRYLSGRCGGTTRVGVLIGGVAAGAVLMVAVVLLCCFIRKRRILNSKNRINRRLCEATGITIPIYPYKQIKKAADYFCDKRRLGTGAYGAVYLGKLHNDEWVAIKRIKHRSDTDSIEQVMNEIKLLSSVSHPNLVKLLGCSVENDEQILVYEYMPNGTLCQHLQKERGNGLAWPVRLTIATETAQAIAHLHSAINPPIYHRDIKSSNILLDYNFKTKVADFGLSRLGLVAESSHISTAPQGTPGYLDPQYHQNFHLSDKSDVYSFGVVLVEIITALKAVDFSRRQNEVNLASLAVDRIAKGRLDSIIDPFIKQNEDKWTLTSLHKVAELAFRCLAYHSETRPSMVEVAAELEQIRLTTTYAPFSQESLTYASEAPFSSSSSFNGKPIIEIRADEFDTSKLFGSANSIDSDKEFSPVSAQDSWLSEQSSPSSNSLLSK
jgi:serine/threonine protein kinase